MLKEYRIGVDVGAALLFFAVMLPNFVWFAVPAPNDILRAQSVTPVPDAAASVCQVLFTALLVLAKNKNVPAVTLSFPIGCALASYAAYLAAWLFYYRGNAGAVIILLLSLMPCLAFGSYAVGRKNRLPLPPLAVFAVCHLLHGIINFIG